MNPTVVAICSQKGGVSKTTSSCMLAAEAMRLGAKVLLVDSDPQGNARGWVNRLESNGKATPVPISLGSEMHKPGHLDVLSKDFNLVVIDTPPALNQIQQSAMRAADIIVLPTNPGAGELEALSKTLAALGEAQASRPASPASAVVFLTRLDPGTIMAREARKAVEPCGLPILNAEMGFRQAYFYAFNAGLGLHDYAPKDPAFTEIHAFCKEISAIAKRRKQAHGGSQEARTVHAIHAGTGRNRQKRSA